MTTSRKGRTLFLVLLIFFVGAIARAQEKTDQILSPYFIVDNGNSSIETFPLKSTDVTVNVNGVIADVVVRQIYANEGAEPINARYVFPGSTRSSIHGMKITIGNQMVEQLLLHTSMTKRQATEFSIEMLNRVGISDAKQRFAQYAFELSGGMRQRAMIAMGS